MRGTSAILSLCIVVLCFATLHSRFYQPTPELKQEMMKYQALLKDVTPIIDPSLPSQWDLREAYPHCVHPILNQGHCGSCWAFAASETLSDRFCIQGNVSIVLSPQHLLSCERYNLGCLMGSLPNLAWDYMKSKGVVTMECQPYYSGNGQNYACLGTKCANGSTGTLYYAEDYYHVGDFFNPKQHVSEIMEALQHGPIDATFNVYGDFGRHAGDSWKNGIYRHLSGSYEGLHSVKVIGYGTIEGEDYWLVANSWGPSWGDQGYFKIRRGTNECFFETLMYTGNPKLSS